MAGPHPSACHLFELPGPLRPSAFRTVGNGENNYHYILAINFDWSTLHASRHSQFNGKVTGAWADLGKEWSNFSQPPLLMTKRGVEFGAGTFTASTNNYSETAYITDYEHIHFLTHKTRASCKQDILMLMSTLISFLRLNGLAFDFAKCKQTAWKLQLG